jgi:hypothetical protein
MDVKWTMISDVLVQRLSFIKRLEDQSYVSMLARPYDQHCP